MAKIMKAPYGENIQKLLKKQDSPFYFYDLDSLENHLKGIADILHPDIKLWYACKANPMSAVLKIFRNLKFGIDVASQGELDQALRSGIKPEGILSTGPAKSKTYLKSLMENEVKIIVAESINQLKEIDEVAKEANLKVDVLLRVQLNWNKGESVLGGDQVTPFGIGIEDWEIHDFDQYQNANIVGLHAFQWGNILNLNDLREIWFETAKKLTEFAKKKNIKLDVLDLGGGLGIPYTTNEKDLNFNDIHDILLELKSEFKLDKIWMELGRYAVGSCGYYFAKVVDRKTVRGKEVIVLNGGINHMARPALTGQFFPCELVSQVNGESNKEKKQSYQIHGPLCTALDYLGTFSLAESASIDDWICFYQAGAYGFTEAMPFFLCHDLPSESIYYRGDFMSPRPPKTSADWMI